MYKGQRNPPRLTEPLKELSELPPINPFEEEVKHHHSAGIDPRPKMHKPLDGILVPRFNTLYDSAGSTQGWRYMSDVFAHGTISTSVNSTVSVPVTAATTPNFRLQQWPGAVQLFLAIRFFGIVPSAVPTANAGMECLFTDNGGNIVPIGELLAQSGGNSNYDVILPNPLTDPGSNVLGTLSISLANVASSNGTYLWSLGFSAIYVLPSRYGYEIIEGIEYEQIDSKIKEKIKHDHH